MKKLNKNREKALYERNEWARTSALKKEQKKTPNQNPIWIMFTIKFLDICLLLGYSFLYRVRTGKK